MRQLVHKYFHPLIFHMCRLSELRIWPVYRSIKARAGGAADRYWWKTDVRDRGTDRIEPSRTALKLHHITLELSLSLRLLAAPADLRGRAAEPRWRWWGNSGRFTRPQLRGTVPRTVCPPGDVTDARVRATRESE